MPVPTKPVTPYDLKIRVAIKVAIVMLAMAGVMGMTWFNEARTGIAQFGGGPGVFEAIDPINFALRHHRTLLITCLYVVGAVAAICYTTYYTKLRNKLRQGNQGTNKS